MVRQIVVKGCRFESYWHKFKMAWLIGKGSSLIRKTKWGRLPYTLLIRLNGGKVYTVVSKTTILVDMRVRISLESLNKINLSKFFNYTCNGHYKKGIDRLY